MISEMDFVKGMTTLEENYGSKYSSTVKASIRKNLERMELQADEWDRLIPYLQGRHSRKPGIPMFSDGLRDLRGESSRKGVGPTLPPKGSGKCATCHGKGVVFNRTTRAAAFCGCDNSDRAIFLTQHRYDFGKFAFVKERTKYGDEIPTLKELITSGHSSDEFETMNHCRIDWNRERQREENHAVLREMHEAGKWIPKRMMAILGLEGEEKEMPQVGQDVSEEVPF